MANWYGTSRTNYVTPTDLDALKASVSRFPITMQYRESDGTVMFMDEDGIDGFWPSCSRPDVEPELDFTWEEYVMPFIKEGEVLVIMQIGAEKRRYVTGWTVAYVRKGKRVRSVFVTLDDIYEKAAKKFKLPFRPTAESINRAEY